ncbi:Putative uncharacterized transposon-derived protein F52C9.6 [Eumeta japonica]|uniref:Uncharacterized transposon-derived protein F52C9.6 n=1 Tax=Eumeta variegata TaxID=151549 RepID=A0A4C1Z350_EUMVA|nr:Putative uncharacterized transposon-derived protein F52C9.6 [Eumeta japonica]
MFPGEHFFTYGPHPTLLNFGVDECQYTLHGIDGVGPWLKNAAEETVEAAEGRQHAVRCGGGGGWFSGANAADGSGGGVRLGPPACIALRRLLRPRSRSLLGGSVHAVCISRRLIAAVVYVFKLSSVVKRLQSYRYWVLFLYILEKEDNLIIISDNQDHLQTMLEQLEDESKKVGLEMNLTKTKLMTNRTKTPIIVNNTTIEYVDEYIYLGQTISPENDASKETQNRINIAWKRYWSLKEIVKNPSVPLHLKSKLFNISIFPTMTYGCRTWTLTAQNLKKTRSLSAQHGKKFTKHKTER